MIKEVFQTALCELETAFSRKLRAGQWDLWWSHFGELTEEQWVRMIAYAIRTYDTFPSVARMYLARNSVPSSSQSDFDWENKSIYWRVVDGILTHKVVPKGQGNAIPGELYPEEGLSEEQMARNRRRVRELIAKVAPN